MTAQSRKANPTTVLVLLILTVQILLLAAVLWRLNQIYRAVIDTGVSSVNDISIVKGVSADDDPVLGSPDAPITVVVFSDYTCGHCRDLESVLAGIQSSNPDRVRVIARDFPLQGVGSASFMAAQAAECADQQSAFWSMREQLFKGQPAFDRGSLHRYAARLSLDLQRFDECLDNPQTQAEIQRDRDDGVSYGVSSTPTLFINGYRLVGAVDLARLQQAINEAR